MHFQQFRSFLLNKIKIPYLRSKILKSKYNPLMTKKLQPYKEYTKLDNQLSRDIFKYDHDLKRNVKYDSELERNDQKLTCGFLKYDHIESCCVNKKENEKIVNI
jgi:hypothetical protein